MTPTLELHRQILAAVAACPERGSVLPHPRQPSTTEGCVSCGELTECRAGLGAHPDGATLEECVRCRYGVVIDAAV